MYESVWIVLKIYPCFSIRLRGLLLEEKAHYMGNDNGRGIERRNTPKEKEKSEGKHQGDVSKI
jgi:hypothetical protein